MWSGMVILSPGSGTYLVYVIEKMKNMNFNTNNYVGLNGTRINSSKSFLNSHNLTFNNKFFFLRAGFTTMSFYSSRNWGLITNRKYKVKEINKTPYDLALEYSNKGVRITALEVNNVLAFTKFSIDQNTLDLILSKNPTNFINLDKNTISSELFLDEIGTIRNEKSKGGVYIWTHIATGKRFFSTTSSEGRQNKNINDPSFISGFTDAEGTFHISVYPRETSKLKWRVQIRLEFCLHEKDLPQLLSIQEYFKGIGYIAIDSKNNKAFFRVSNVQDIIKLIIPHFNKYPLLTKKRQDFLLWSKVANIMEMGGHLTSEGLLEIIRIKANNNKGLSPKLIAAFPNIKPYELPDLQPIPIYDPSWLVGFVAGDGSFSAYPYRSKTYKVKFFITQHNRDLTLLEEIKDYLKVGNIYKNGNSLNYEVGSMKSCLDIIIPFFDRYPIPSTALKSHNFKIWKEIVEILNNKNIGADSARKERIDSLLSEFNKWG